MSDAADPAALEALVEHLSQDPARTAILTDIDGTIAPITARPEQTRVPDHARRALESIRDRFALVACVSGRRATQAREMVGVGGITYSGNHGMETLGPGSDEVRLDLTLRGHEDAAASFLDGLDPKLIEGTGLRREDKGPIQSLHWRGAESEADSERAAVRIAAEAERCGLEPHWGRKVLEIRPAGRGGKGAAITSLLVGSGIEVAVYAGDDKTDIDAFHSLREIAREPGPPAIGVCVGIASAEGPEGLAEVADIVLDGPERWIEILGRLDE